MEKINFQNNITKANAETMTQFQDNIENAINEINYNIITDGEAVKCGYKIDNKDVYVKRINFGNLPNSTLKDVNHNITNFSKIVKIEGTALTNTGYGYSIPNNNMLVFYTNEYVRITTTTNESDYNAEINIYYLGE